MLMQIGEIKRCRGRCSVKCLAQHFADATENVSAREINANDTTGLFPQLAKEINV